VADLHGATGARPRPDPRARRRRRTIATSAVHRGRFSERLLLDIVGLEWDKVHRRADHWRHVISNDVETRLIDLLDDLGTCPHGNPIPGSGTPPTDSHPPLAHVPPVPPPRPASTKGSNSPKAASTSSPTSASSPARPSAGEVTASTGRAFSAPGRHHTMTDEIASQFLGRDSSPRRGPTRRIAGTGGRLNAAPRRGRGDPDRRGEHQGLERHEAVQPVDDHPAHDAPRPATRSTGARGNEKNSPARPPLLASTTSADTTPPDRAAPTSPNLTAATGSRAGHCDRPSITTTPSSEMPD
jgi:hypothetical protein